MAEMSDEHGLYRIALYYWYIPEHLYPVDDIPSHLKFHSDICSPSKLNLHGRIRVSKEGINGVLSGLFKNLKQYEYELNEFLSSCVDVKYCHLRTDLPAKEQLFTNLSVKKTREVVSLFSPTDVNDKNKKGKKKKKNKKKVEQDPINYEKNDKIDGDMIHKFKTAVHLSPEEWHEKLLEESSQSRSTGSKIDENPKSSAILIDARNVYESNVGHFAVPGIPTLLTNTRKFTDLPNVLKSYLDTSVNDESSSCEKDEKDLGCLSEKQNIYMYCTGKRLVFICY